MPDMSEIRTIPGQADRPPLRRRGINQSGSPQCPASQGRSRSLEKLTRVGSTPGRVRPYLARSGFRLDGRHHELVVLWHLTFELHRQEVRTWKKVIRVSSHELNNSLAPIASLACSGGELGALA
jgi:hypothetical protein